MSFSRRTRRISVIFRVRSAKAVKITDASLIKKLGLLCGFVSVALLIRTLVSPPDVIVGRTADNLKAFLCKTDWWDHTFTSSKWCHWISPKGVGFGFIDSFIVDFFLLCRFSGSLVPGVGREVVYRRSQSAIGIQRKPLYIDGNLQRISSYLLSQRFNVSLRALGFALLIVCLHFSWICISHPFRRLLSFRSKTRLVHLHAPIHKGDSWNHNHYVFFLYSGSVAGLRLWLRRAEVATENRRRRLFRGKKRRIEFTWGRIIVMGGRETFEFVWVNVSLP